ncbi:MAG: D-alanine--D-alanine ligase [Tenericutes bacterium]|nr:D-alanine--D-alanine ligase [Mycoplasmatota bacterium]
MKIRIGVIFGGESVEHEVSIITAIQAMNKMDTEKYEIIPIYISKKGEWYTGNHLRDMETYQDLNLLKRYAHNVVLYHKKGNFILQSKGFLKRFITDIDIAFPIVHGTNVEDGVLQGYLHSIGIPFVGSDVYASVVGQDKVFMKQIFESNKLPITKYVWFFDNEYKEDSKAIINKTTKLKYPLIIKPASLGSSVGINIANDHQELINAIEEAINYDHKIIVEEVVHNLKEVNISVLGDYEHQEVSAIEEVTTANALLTYEDKYIGNKNGKGGTISKGSSSLRKIPAQLDDKLQQKIEITAKSAFKALNSSGVVRLDYLIDSKEAKIYINEINNIPGSLSFYLWEKAGKKYSELLDDLINIGIKDYKKRNSKTHSFDSNILQNYNGSKGGKFLKGGIKGKL